MEIQSINGDVRFFFDFTHLKEKVLEKLETIGDVTEFNSAYPSQLRVQIDLLEPLKIERSGIYFNRDTGFIFTNGIGVRPLQVSFLSRDQKETSSVVLNLYLSIDSADIWANELKSRVFDVEEWYLSMIDQFVGNWHKGFCSSGT